MAKTVRTALKAIFCCLLLMPAILYAQDNQPGDSSLAVSLKNARQQFDKAIAHQSGIYNGPKYYLYNTVAIRGSAYYRDTLEATGNVRYDNVEYFNKPLIYDTYKDELVSILFDGYSFYSFLKDRVQNFDLLGHHFINIKADTLTAPVNLQSGFYNELYSGKTQVLAHISKQVNQATSTTGTLDAYSYFTKAAEAYFIRKDNIYFRVTGESSLLDILKDKKQQLKQHIKAERLKFKKDPAQFISSVAAYYDHI